jgi:arabinan endo-1,5-alpha-L-arabinosidase
VNWGTCCRGTNSTYNIRVGRSREITGPYLDRDGKDLAQGGGTLLLGSDGAFIGPGHAGLFEQHGRFYFSCHFYDGTDRGVSKLALRPLRWGPDGWPVLTAPE